LKQALKFVREASRISSFEKMVKKWLKMVNETEKAFSA